jgi:cytochrome b pre-mRNA-processing protein 3
MPALPKTANPMISLPFRRSRRAGSIDALYGMIVAQARSPAFYRDYGVPDTVEGRLDMLMLHLVLLIRRLGQDQPRGTDIIPAAGQRLFDRFCRDIDANFREMGVGDLTVPKKMRQVAEAYYGRARAYEHALQANDMPALEAALARGAGAVDVATLKTDMTEAAARAKALYDAFVAEPAAQARMRREETGG